MSSYVRFFIFRFYFCHGLPQESSQRLEQQLNGHCGNEDSCSTFETELHSILRSDSPSLDQQCKFINTISNTDRHHKRPFAQRFSNSNVGPPVCNRVRLVWAYGHPDREDILNECMSSPEPHKTVHLVQRKKAVSIVSSTSSKTFEVDQPQTTVPTLPLNDVTVETITTEHISTTLSAVSINLGESHSVDDVVSNMQNQNLTIYENFVHNMKIHPQAFLATRFQSQQKNVYCLNDLDSQRGTFSHCDFVHCSEILTERGYIYTCECKIYKTLLDDARKVSNCTNLQYYAGVMCVHVRFLKEHSTSEDSPFRHKFMPTSVPSMQCIYTSENNRKYSVIDGDSVSRVHLFRQTTTGQYIVSCQSGFCRAQKGAKRSVRNLASGDLCQHLSVFAQHEDLWADFMNFGLSEGAEDMPESEAQGAEFAPPLHPDKDKTLDTEVGWHDTPSDITCS